ncbi:hypothetical protein GCM10009755_26530 [Brevibacterium samyangense]|uniref:Uncharacterized protein n=1 Tax=Brevibacterium samyangense TaxID=366888 RepID=A0ABP5F3I1_9MICO
MCVVCVCALREAVGPAGVSVQGMRLRLTLAESAEKNKSPGPKRGVWSSCGVCAEFSAVDDRK